MNIPLIELSKEVTDQIDLALQKYPKNRSKSAIMPALSVAQKANGGYLTSPIIEAVANYLAIPPITAYEVATFYSLYEHKPVGRYKIAICTNVSCMLRGCDQLLEHVEKRLGIGVGETTPDKRFTLKRVECLAACDIAPALQINDTLYGDLNSEKLNQILHDLDNHQQ